MNFVEFGSPTNTNKMWLSRGLTCNDTIRWYFATSLWLHVPHVVRLPLQQSRPPWRRPRRPPLWEMRPRGHGCIYAPRTCGTPARQWATRDISILRVSLHLSYEHRGLTCIDTIRGELIKLKAALRRILTCGAPEVPPGSLR